MGNRPKSRKKRLHQTLRNNPGGTMKAAKAEGELDGIQMAEDQARIFALQSRKDHADG